MRTLKCEISFFVIINALFTLLQNVFIFLFFENNFKEDFSIYEETFVYGMIVIRTICALLSIYGAAKSNFGALSAFNVTTTSNLLIAIAMFVRKLQICTQDASEISAFVCIVKNLYKLVLSLPLGS